jgi:hypothetical protein
MANLADLDTSFLVPCRHCGDLLPEQDRICPHCGKDQTVAPDKAGASEPPALASGATDAFGPLPLAADAGAGDFTRAGLGARADDGGAARRRRKAIGVVALLAGVLLLGMAYDRYVKQQSAATSPSTSSAAGPTSREERPTPPRSATATGPVVRTPAVAVSPPAANPTGAPASASVTPAASADARESAPGTASSSCNEALAALSLCTVP